MGKKNNQTSVSDADREIPTFGSRDNAQNSVKPHFWHYLFTLRLGFLSLHRRLMIDSTSQQNFVHLYEENDVSVLIRDLQLFIFYV